MVFFSFRGSPSGLGGGGGSKGDDERVLVALGGVGEIGMKAYLYGFGAPDASEWLMVDCGITLPEGEFDHGIDVILPDISFLEEERHNIVGLLLTHAHEDHYGAVADLWPRLGNMPVYATPFTAEMLKSKLGEMGVAENFPLEIVAMGSRRSIGPFDVELVSMSHSIPEPSAIAIRTPLLKLAGRLEAIVEDAPDWLDGQGRARIEGARHSLAWRIDLIAAWEALLSRLGGPADPEFIDWLQVDRNDSREFDGGDLAEQPARTAARS